VTELVCLGSLVRDFIFRVPSIPATPQKLTASSLRLGFGGMAAVAAVTASRLGIATEYWGRIGDDDTGVEARAALAEQGVKVFANSPVGSRTPAATVIVEDSGERMLAVYPGNLDTSAAWLPLEHLDHAKAVHADYRWLDGSRALYAAARARGLPRMMDADTGNPKAIRELMQLANHVIFSEGGLAEVAGTVVGSDPIGVLKQVAPQIDGVVGVTLGERGSLFIVDGDLYRFSTPVVQVVDSNGAGDVFHGAYAVAIVRGEDPHEAVRYASAAAALKCSREAGWNNLPRQEEVLAFMKEHPCQS